MTERRPPGRKDRNGPDSMFREAGGKYSATRVSAMMCLFGLLVLALWAASAQKWETVATLAGYLSALAFALYGVNRTPSMIDAAKGKPAEEKKDAP